MQKTIFIRFLTILLPGFVSAQTLPLVQEIPIEKAATSLLTLEGYPDFLASDENGVWVTNEGRVEKLVFGKDKPVATVAIPEPCGAMAVGFGSLWVASCGKKSVYRIDLKTHTVQAIILTGLADPRGELSIAVGAGSVWLLTSPRGELSRIDPAKNEIVAHIEVAPDSFAAVFGDGSVWITNSSHASVQRVDPKTEKVVATIKVGKTPRFLTAGLGAIWTLNQEDGTVSRIDPKNHHVTSIAVNAKGTGGDIATGEKYLFVRAKTSLLFVIDPSSNQVIRSYGPAAGSGAVRAEHGRVWITAHDIHRVWVVIE